ncbi:MAG: hypothetical protein D6731_13455 [Planctomycetota bacterium]|nr:MAG: hypothetical protein D6731_13455 [Planctomycetota bacterium]
MTKRLYRERPADTEFWGAIEELERDDEGAEVVLDQTLFYPESGGQPCDLGSLGGVAVLSVREREDGAIVHRVAADPKLKKWYPGRELEGTIDGVRRRDHMQQHSGQHLLSAILARHGLETLSFHLGSEVCAIDVPCEALAADLLRAVEEEANDAIRACHPVKVSTHRGEGVTPLGLRKEPPPELFDSPEGLRIVQIGPDDAPLDLDPCCGTHVTNTGELGALFLLGSERGRKGTARLSFVVGRRAVVAVRERLDALRATGEVLSVGPSDAPARARKLLATVKELTSERKRARARLAELEARACVGEAANGTVLAKLLDEHDPDFAATFARACAKERPGVAVAVVHRGERATLCLARAPGPGPHLGDVLREVLAGFSAKGGGSPAFARGAVGDPGRAEELLATARAALADGADPPAAT